MRAVPPLWGAGGSGPPRVSQPGQSRVSSVSPEAQPLERERRGGFSALWGWWREAAYGLATGRAGAELRRGLWCS